MNYFTCDGLKIPYITVKTDNGPGVMVPSFAIPPSYWQKYRTAWHVATVNYRQLADPEELERCMRIWAGDGLARAAEWGGGVARPLDGVTKDLPSIYKNKIHYGIATIPVEYIKQELGSNEFGEIAL